MAEEIKDEKIIVEGAEGAEGATPAAKGKGKAGKKEAGETIEIEKSVLAKLIDRLDILEEAADKGRLERVKGLRNNDKLVKKVNLGVYDGRIVVGWKAIKDDVWFDQEGKMHEEQIVELYFHEGKKDKEGHLVAEAQMNVQSFSRRLKRLICEVVEESKDRNGNTTLTVVTPEGKEIKVDLSFINAA